MCLRVRAPMLPLSCTASAPAPNQWQWQAVHTTCGSVVPAPRAGHAAVAVDIGGPGFLVFGGMDAADHWLNDLYLFTGVCVCASAHFRIPPSSSYTEANCSWRKIETQNTPCPRAFVSSTVWDHVWYLYGGSIGTASENDEMFALPLDAEHLGASAEPHCTSIRQMMCVHWVANTSDRRVVMCRTPLHQNPIATLS